MNGQNSKPFLEWFSEEQKEALLAMIAEFDEAMKKIAEAMKTIKEECGGIDEMDDERRFWRAAAALTRSKAASRAQAFACRMAQEKARMAMKRRKLMHAEGHFPDMACGL